MTLGRWSVNGHPNIASRVTRKEITMILLTGATGTAGSFIANEFAEQRVPVRILVRDKTKAKRLESVSTIEMVEGDMSAPRNLTSALKGVDRVLMISGPSADMVETQCTFIDACKAAGVRHIIKFSGLDARPDTTFLFGIMHKRIEEYLEKSGLAWTHLRPTGFMQEYLREAPSIIRDGALYLALGDARLNPVDLLDVGKIGFLLLRDGGHQGERLAVTGPEALSMAEIAERISHATEADVRYVPVRPEQRRQALISHGIPVEIADALDAQVQERLRGGLESKVDLSTHQLFGVKPTTFLEFAKRNSMVFSRTYAAV
jgi:uncharacterized protein YbjT (DUF2867 family)